jgi:hypothetical protein
MSRDGASLGPPAPGVTIEAGMTLRDNLPAQVVLMLGVALHELQQSEAETDLHRIRDLITNAQSTLIELHGIAEKACEEVDADGKT